MVAPSETRAHVPQTESRNFLRFAECEEYRRVNRELLEEVFPHLPSIFFQVDVASGTGLVPQEMAKLCKLRGKRGRIIGVEPDHFAVEKARQILIVSGVTSYELVEGYGQDLEELLKGRIPEEGVDYVSIHDAIHEIEGIEDKRLVLGAMARSIKPEGLLSMNSAFTSVAQTRPWGELKLDVLKNDGLKRNKLVERETRAIDTLTPQQYRELLEEQGLIIIHDVLKIVTLSRKALEGISIYPKFVEGFFRDVESQDRIDDDKKTEMLVESLERRGVQQIDRVWHELIGRKAA